MRALRLSYAFARVLALALVFATTGNAYAVDTMPGKTTPAIGAELRTEFIHDDRGVEKLYFDKLAATNTFRLTDVKISLTGEFNDATNYRLRLNMNPQAWQLGNAADRTELAYATMRLNNHLSLSVGKDRVMQGGWDNFDQEFDAIWGISSYMGPFKAYAPAATLAFNQAHGTLSLQMTNDVTTTSGILSALLSGKNTNTTNADGQWNTTQKQPAFILDYRGIYRSGLVRPLLQIGQYDANHSRFIDIGAKISRGPLNFTMDYLVDNRSEKTSSGAEKYFTYTLTALRADYTIDGLAKPFIYWTQTNTTGETNLAQDTSPTSYAASLGATYLGFGTKYAPYLAYHRLAGKYVLGDVEKTATQNSVRIGVMGSI
jgi:hypothetical protein